MKLKLKYKINFIDIVVLKLNCIVKKEDLELTKMRLGLEVIIINISKFIIVFLVSKCFNVLKETLFMMFIFSNIRSTAFGLHAKNTTICTVITCIMFILGSYLSYKIRLDNNSLILLFIIMMIYFCKYAPADTESHPLLKRQLRLTLKKQTILKVLFFMIIAIIIKNHVIKTLIVLALVFNIISILPISYKILNRRYNNYEEYEKTTY